MRFLACVALITLIAAGSLAAAAPLPPPQQVDISAPEGVLHAQLYRPEGNGPFPTVIALHGCGGLGGH
jgi:poly(3-hydroxybutyrate) depolymerase